MQPPSGLSPAESKVADLFALTDDQILQMEPDAQDIEVFGGERSDRMDPLRADLDLLTDANSHVGREPAAEPGNGKVAPAAVPAAATTSGQNAPPANAATADDAAKSAAKSEAPQWLGQRMNDPQLGADAREFWQGVQAARQEASAFREVFAKPEDARAAAVRARTLEDFDRAYFGVPGSAPEQTTASRAQLAQQMMREDPAAFREMVFAGLRALENAGQQGQAHPPDQSSQETQRQNESPQRQENSRQQQSVSQQEARVTAYAAFERAANEELDRGVSGAIERSLQQALPNANRTENGASLKQRLATAVRQDVEKALQGDQALGEQVARMLSGQRLDNSTRAQVVRVIGERAHQLVPGATRRVLADWTQTTLASHGARSRGVDAGGVRSNAHVPSGSNASRVPRVTQQLDANANANDRVRESQRNSAREAATGRAPRKIDYRRTSDEQILDS